jgi:hypothetical protein
LKALCSLVYDNGAGRVPEPIYYTRRSKRGKWLEGRRQKAEGRKQKAESRKQKAESRKQKAESRKQKNVGVA